MRHNPFTIEKLKNQNLQQLLSTQLKECPSRYERACGSMTDSMFIKACLKRVITQNQSGRDFLQAIHEIDHHIVPRATFFDALKSNRRLMAIEEVSRLYNKKLAEQLSYSGVDYLSDLSEIQDYEVYSADGHFIEHPSHLAQKCERVFAPGNLYIQNIRNGLIHLLAPVTDGTSKEHEMPHFRRALEHVHPKRKTIWVADRAYLDNRWWEKQKLKGHYVISRAKSNRVVMYCGQYQFDANDPVNAGVVRDRIGGFTNTQSILRIIDYVDPETGEAMTFYTTLNEKIRPGVICWLYFLRWKIEKAFDCFKNSLGEKKAWAVGKNALQIQGHSICILYNFVQFLSETIQKTYHCTDKKSEKKYSASLMKRQVRAAAAGRSIHPLLMLYRHIARISSQFFRVVRNHFSSEKPLYRIIPIFIKRLEAYL